jgi:hypothetical protein
VCGFCDVLVDGGPCGTPSSFSQKQQQKQQQQQQNSGAKFSEAQF